MTTTTELMRARFREVSAEKVALEAACAPLFQQRDDLLAEIDAKQAVLRQITEAINQQYKPEAIRIAEEMSTLVRVLKGQTGEA